VVAVLYLQQLDSDMSEVFAGKTDESKAEDATVFRNACKQFYTPEVDVDFYVKLAVLFSKATDSISSLRAGFIQLGNVCNLQTNVEISDVQSWLMVMQVWGEYESFLFLPLEVHRINAHQSLVKC